MPELSIDEIGYEELRKYSLHNSVKRSVAARVGFELASRLEALASDEERVDLLMELQVRPYVEDNRVSEHLGLHILFEKMTNVYIPAYWGREYREIEALSAEGRNKFRTNGMLASNEDVSYLHYAEGRLDLNILEMFRLTIDPLPATVRMAFFAYNSEWRRNVMQYEHFMLDLLIDELEKRSSQSSDEEKAYVAVVLPLPQQYKREVEAMLGK